MPSKKSTTKKAAAKLPPHEDYTLRIVRMEWNRRMGKPAPLRPDELPTTEQLANLTAGILALKSGAGAAERRQAAAEAMEIWRECAELGIIEKQRSRDHWTRQDQKDAEHPPELGLIAQEYAEKHGIKLPDMAGKIITWEEAVRLFSPWNHYGSREDELRHFRSAEQKLERVVETHRPHAGAGGKRAGVEFWKPHGFQRPEFWELIYLMAKAEVSAEMAARGSRGGKAPRKKAEKKPLKKKATSL